jgi:hypothetical protein
VDERPDDDREPLRLGVISFVVFLRRPSQVPELRYQLL